VETCSTAKPGKGKGTRAEEPVSCEQVHSRLLREDDQQYPDVGAVLTTDHFQPTSRGGAEAPANWVYCCFACNIAKGDYWQPDSLQRILHPLHDNLSEHIMEQEDGTLHGLTSTGHFHIAQLRLNRPADRAGYMTGQAINVTCGLIMH